MSIQAFSYPVPETRFFQAGQHVYKCKIRKGERSSNFIREECSLDEELVNEELEDAVRAVLANLDGLHPFTTQHFNIFPYKSKWERVSKLRLMKEGVKLSAYPFLITLYVECREPAGRSVLNTSVCNLPERETILLCAGDTLVKDQTTAAPHPEEGVMSQGNQHKPSSENLQFLQHGYENPQAGIQYVKYKRTNGSFFPCFSFRESHCLADGAEGMVCGSEIHAESDDVVPKTSDPDSVTGQNTGIITKLASSLFPFSMFFRKSSAK
ncbi:membrane-anchored junction protein [Paramisgurnus dabryanus]|uniref:membrane-anchored junction protein n=1 Tax=Paramisgurnus dabryanus TaxID=90735 RepID=UPI0031F3A632